MHPIKQKLDLLVKQWTLTKPDEEAEEYILSKSEEEQSTTHAIQRAKEAYQFRHLELGDRLVDIEQKISQMNWVEEIDLPAILKTANSNKQYEVWLKAKREEERRQEEQKKKELIEKHTAKFIFNIMSWTSENTFGKRLIVNENNKHLIKTICYFLSSDERFVSELGYSFAKGLLIRGVSGLGKTFLFECIKNNELHPILIYSMIEISEIVKAEGAFELPTQGLLYLDDVGTEEHIVNHYGTKINFFKNFIEKYYLNNRTYSNLIISTNNNFSELEEKYGFRVRSRIKDIFNIVDVVGTDMRGQ